MKKKKIKKKEKGKTPQSDMIKEYNELNMLNKNISKLKEYLEDKNKNLEILKSTSKQKEEGINEEKFKLSVKVENKKKQIQLLKAQISEAKSEKVEKITALSKSIADKEELISKLEGELKKIVKEKEDIQTKAEEIKKNGEETLKSLEWELFYSLAVAIKLNMSLRGTHCTQNITKLFDLATEKNIPRSTWNRWIHQQLEKG